MGEPVIGGFLSLLVDRLVQAGGAIPPSTHTGFVTPFDPEIFKLVALDLLDDAGVQFLFHASASGVIGGQRLEGVIFETKSGPVVIRAKVVVDCTGDGDVAAWAGAPYEVGDENGLVQPMTLMFLMREFGKEAFAEYVKSHPEQWLGVHGLWDLIRRATQAGDLEMPREDVLFFATPHRGEVSVNSTRIIKVLGTDVWDLTYAEWEGRRQVRMIANFLKKYVPGFGNSYIGQSGAHVGVRETRRILGEYQLTEEDVLNGRRFEDVIARGSYPLDFHNPTGPGTFLKPLPPGESYDIPLRCLLPRKVEQLIVAGRCLSGTQKAQSSFRTMPICMATGHAAGVCAAWSVRSGKPPREVPARDVQQSLKQQKANLGS